MADGRLVLDVQRAVAPRVAGGIPEDRLQAMAQAATRAFRQVNQWRDDGKLGFARLPNDAALLEETVGMARSVKASARDLVVVGLGGGALGARVLCTALAQRGGLRVHVVDQPDPRAFGELLGRVDPQSTVINVVSRSGQSLEAVAPFLVIRDLLRGRLGKKAFAERVIVTTDAEAGPLRAIATRDGLRTLPYPKDVQSRFSILAPAALMPAAAAGVDVGSVLDGARTMADRCGNTAALANPAALLALVHYIADRELERNVHVLSAWGDSFRPFAQWWTQVWAETLGKRLSLEGTEIHNGPTPLTAVGLADPPGLTQLLLEGPADKMVTFLHVDERSGSLECPPAADVPELGFLGGIDFGAMMDAQRRALEHGLMESGRPSVRLTLPSMNPRSFGELLYLVQHTAVFLAALYGIDPFDQAATEESRKVTFGLLGRKGFEAAGDRVRPGDTNSKWRLA